LRWAACRRLASPPRPAQLCRHAARLRCS